MTWKSFSRIITTSAVLCICITFGSPMVVEAADEPLAALSDEQLRIAQERMQAAGVDEAGQATQLAKLARGEALDSTLGRNPVRSFPASVDGSHVRMTEYADGSRRWEPIFASVAGPAFVGIEPAEASVADCTDAPGVGTFWHLGCRVSTEDAVSTAGFIVDVKTSEVPALPAEVRDPRGAYCSLAGGSCSVSSATVDRAVAAGTAPARASMAFTGTFMQDAASVAGSVWIDVVGTSVTASNTPVSWVKGDDPMRAGGGGDR